MTIRVTPIGGEPVELAEETRCIGHHDRHGEVIEVLDVDSSDGEDGDTTARVRFPKSAYPGQVEFRLVSTLTRATLSRPYFVHVGDAWPLCEIETWRARAERLERELADRQKRIDGALAIIAGWLGTIEHAPATWGNRATLETICVSLTELRQRLLRPVAHAADDFETRDAWIRFIGRVNGSHTSSTLYDVLRERRQLDRLPSLLGELQRRIASELPPEITPAVASDP